MAFAPQLWMLLLGRAIAGLTSANVSVATAYITDISPEDTRARRFGLFNAMFGIGFSSGRFSADCPATTGCGFLSSPPSC